MLSRQRTLYQSLVSCNTCYVIAAPFTRLFMGEERREREIVFPLHSHVAPALADSDTLCVSERDLVPLCLLVSLIETTNCSLFSTYHFAWVTLEKNIHTRGQSLN